MHYAASYGRLPHIYSDFCEIKPLSEDDFQDYDWNMLDPADMSREQERLYLVHYAELSSRGTDTDICRF